MIAIVELLHSKVVILIYRWKEKRKDVYAVIVDHFLFLIT